jgi:hypothetical protein
LKHEKGVWSSANAEQSARHALPFWLMSADLTDNSVSTIPEMFFAILREYHETFLDFEGAQVFCHECHRVIDRPILTSTHLPPREIFDYMRYEWHCPDGHLLYKDEVGRHGVP